MPRPRRPAWHAYPALYAALLVSLGVMLGDALSFLGWTAVMAGVLGVAGLLRLTQRGRLVSAAPFVAIVTTALLAIALGGARSAYDRLLPAGHLAHLVPAHETVATWIEGTLGEESSATSSGLRFVLRAERTVSGTDTLSVRGDVLVYLRMGDPGAVPALPAGTRLGAWARLEHLGGRRNPADFDAAHFYAGRGLVLRATVAGLDDLTLVSTTGHDGPVLFRFRQTIRHKLHAYVPDAESRALLHALLLGDRALLDGDVRERFARTGLAHVLAVSGLHVLLVGLVLYGLLRPLLMRMGLRRRQPIEVLRALITLGLLAGYVVVAGASASAVRAGVMAVLFIGGTVLHRSAHPLNTLGVAALVLLLWRPGQLTEAGFLLSFSAVGAIVGFGPLLHTWLDRWPPRSFRRWLANSVGATLAATAGTMPVLLAVFGQVPLGGLVLNVLAIPLTGLLLAAGLVTAATAGSVAAVFGRAASLLGEALHGLTVVGERWLDWAVVDRFVTDGWLLAALSIGLVTLMQVDRPRLRWRGAALAAACLAASVWLNVARETPAKALDVLFFDVGHGDAALLQFPEGQAVLIDAGARDAYTDRGVRTILPHLERYGIRRLDAVVVSHPHGDHLGGLPALLRALPVGRVIHNGHAHPSALLRETQHLLDSLSIEERVVGAGDTLQLSPVARTYVFGPTTADAEATIENANDASLVLQVVYGDTALLFTGDAEADAEARLVTRYGALLRSMVVKVGHHGSRTSSTPAFIARAAQPGGVAVVSASHRGRFGLPHGDVLDRWEQAGATVWVTGQRGALWLRSDGSRMQAVPWR